MFVTIFVLLIKICQLKSDTAHINKLVYRQYWALLGWAFFELVNIASVFFVNPENLFDKYILPFSKHPVADILNTLKESQMSKLSDEIKDPSQLSDEYRTSAIFIIQQISFALDCYCLILALSYQLLYWLLIQQLIQVQRKHQREIVDLQKVHFKAVESKLQKAFWLVQLMIFSGYVLSMIMDLLECTKQWIRYADVVNFCITMVCFLFVYLLLVSTAKLSANLAYQQHRTQLFLTFVFVQVCLAIKTSLAITNLTDPRAIQRQQLTSLMQKSLVFLPAVFYSIMQKSAEDCLVCFSRFPETTLFSRYQIRKETNCIAQKTLKTSQEQVLKSQSNCSRRDTGQNLLYSIDDTQSSIVQNRHIQSLDQDLLKLQGSRNSSSPLNSNRATGIFESTARATDAGIEVIEGERSTETQLRKHNASNNPSLLANLLPCSAP